MCDDDDDILRSRWIDHGPPRDPRLPSAYDPKREYQEARNRTDPHTRQNPKGKTFEAWRTLVHSTQDIDTEAGWAIDHILGLSMAGLKMEAKQPGDMKDHAEYLAYLAAADTHEHEVVGSGNYHERPDHPDVRRLFLRNLVFAKACAMPDWLRAELLEALDALDAGTAMPLLERAKRTGTEFVEARARLRLVTFVKFRSRAYAISQEQVRAEIAEATGPKEETLDSWETRLKDSCLGPIEVAREITFASIAADNVRYIAQRRDEVAEEEIRITETHARKWNGAALNEAIAEWKRAKGRRRIN